MTGLMKDQNPENQLEKQIGCMSGFLHIFDRQQILAGKRIHSAKHLPTSTGVAMSPDSVNSVQKPAPAEQVVTSTERADGFPPSPAATLKFFPTLTPPRSPLPLPVFEVEGSMMSSWQFFEEMPRLSLDSRATVDSKGTLCPRDIRPDASDGSFEKQRRLPSVIARLMGLEPLPSSNTSSSSPGTVKEPELRRSASESGVSRDLFHSRLTDGNNYQAKQPNQTNLTNNNCARREVANRNVQNGRIMESMKYSSRNQKNELPKTSQWKYVQRQRRSFFDSADFFPEPKQTMVATSEKNLKLRGVDEQSKDLEALKHILEALQLEGLLHSINSNSQRNFVYDRSFLSDDYSNGVLMKRRRSPASNRRLGNYSVGMNKYSGEISPSKERGAFNRSGRNPVRAKTSPVRSRIESNTKNCNTNDKIKPLRIQTQKRFHEASESKRNSPINSPKLTPKRSGSEHHSVATNRSPRSKSPSEKIYSKQKASRTVVVEDESSSFSESSGSTASQFDPESSKMEEYKEGKGLLARCDRLLAEKNSITESLTSSNSVLPSPVSVLDSAFDRDESSSLSPVIKRTTDFKDLTVDLEDDIWSSIICPAISTEDEDFISGDPDFTYISEILRAAQYLPVEPSVFCFLEKQQYLNGNDSSNSSKLRRKLVFDTVTEILDRNRNLTPWNSISLTESNNSIKKICIEFHKLREPDTADNLVDLICTVLKKDLDGNNGWGDHPVEKADAGLYVERLIFKDLVTETIRDLADVAGKTTFFAPQRKLVF